MFIKYPVNLIKMKKLNTILKLKFRQYSAGF
jgi:hypothetical protein